MLLNLKLGTHLLIAFLFVDIIPFAIIGLVSMTKATTALQNQAFNQLEAVREIKKNQVLSYFKSIENQIVTVISASVEEQSASTSEIVENITQAASGISDITDNISQSSSKTMEISNDISDVTLSANIITDHSINVKSSAEKLSSLAQTLNTLVGKFKV